MRLRTSPEFRRVQRGGRRVQGRFLVGIHRANGLNGPRLGLAVSRKVGNAVMRNRVKRRIRESFRRQAVGLTGVDVVFIARPAAAGASFAELHAEVGRVIAVIRGSGD